MSLIRHCIQDIKSRIPYEILTAVFTPNTSFGMSQLQYTNFNIDSQIREKVIEARVRRDVDTFGVQEEIISLQGLPRQLVEGQIFPAWTCNIPKDRTGDRTITTVLSALIQPLGWGNGVGGIKPIFGANARCQPSDLISLGRTLVESNDEVQINQTVEVSLIGENTVYVKNFGINMPNLAIRCLLASDTEFSTIKRPSWRIFSEIVVEATKAYIYNNYIIKMDKDELYAGQALGVFRNIIEGYSDADENYRTLVKENLGKLLSFNDDSRMDRFVKGMFGRHA